MQRCLAVAVLLSVILQGGAELQPISLSPSVPQSQTHWNTWDLELPGLPAGDDLELKIDQIPTSKWGLSDKEFYQVVELLQPTAFTTEGGAAQDPDVRLVQSDTFAAPYNEEVTPQCTSMGIAEFRHAVLLMPSLVVTNTSAWLMPADHLEWRAMRSIKRFPRLPASIKTVHTKKLLSLAHVNILDPTCFWIDQLPRLLYASALLKADPEIMILMRVDKEVEVVLQHLGIPADRIMKQQRGMYNFKSADPSSAVLPIRAGSMAYSAEHLYVVDCLPGPALTATLPQELYSSIPRIMEGLQAATPRLPTEQTHVLFVCEENDMDSISNSDTLLAKIRARAEAAEVPFLTVKNADVTKLAKLQVAFRDARVVVGPAGPAFRYLTLCRPGTGVVLIDETEGGSASEFVVLAGKLNLSTVYAAIKDRLPDPVGVPFIAHNIGFVPGDFVAAAVEDAISVQNGNPRTEIPLSEQAKREGWTVASQIMLHGLTVGKQVSQDWKVSRHAVTDDYEAEALKLELGDNALVGQAIPLVLPPHHYGVQEPNTRPERRKR